MPINFFGFFFARTIALRRGASDQEANRAGFVGAIIRPPILGVLVAERAPVAPPAPAPGRLPPPRAKPELKAWASSSSQVNLSWTEPVGATNYNILRRPKSEKDPQVVASNLSVSYYSNTGLDADVYVYVIVANFPGNDTTQSDPAEVSTTSL
jgi:hypothetical protein